MEHEDITDAMAQKALDEILDSFNHLIAKLETLKKEANPTWWQKP
jgi:hypothetical protein